MAATRTSKPCNARVIYKDCEVWKGITPPFCQHQEVFKKMCHET